MSKPDSPAFLSPLQQRLVSIALVVLALNLIGGFCFGVFLLLRWIVVYFSAILWPLAVAGILALLLKPLVLGLQKTLRIGRMWAIGVLYGFALICAMLIAALLLPVFLAQAGDFLEYVPILLDQVANLLGRIFPEGADRMQAALSAEALRGHLNTLTGHFQEILKASLPALKTLNEFLSHTFTLAAGLAIIPVYVFFFLLTDKDVLRSINDQLAFIPETVRDDITFLAGEFSRIMVAFFRGQILIGLIMGVLMAIGFTLAGLKFGAFLGLIIGMLNIIPYLGSILGLLTVLPLAYLQQDGGLAVLFLSLGIFAGVQLTESYLLTPRIMGRSTGLHPLTIIVAIFFWGTALGGILGMILAIPLTAFFVVAWRLIRKKYLEPEASLERVPGQG